MLKAFTKDEVDDLFENFKKDDVFDTSRFNVFIKELKSVKPELSETIDNSKAYWKLQGENLLVGQIKQKLKTIKTKPSASGPIIQSSASGPIPPSTASGPIIQSTASGPIPPSTASGAKVKIETSIRDFNINKYVETIVKSWNANYLQIGELETTRQLLEFILKNKREEVPPNTTITSTIHSLAVVIHKLGRIIYQNKDLGGATEGKDEATVLYNEAQKLYEEALRNDGINNDLNKNLEICKSELEQIINNAPFTEPITVINVPQDVDGISAEKQKQKSVFTDIKTLVSETFKIKPVDKLSFLSKIVISPTVDPNGTSDRPDLISDFVKAYNSWGTSIGKAEINFKIYTKKEVDEILSYIKTDSMYTYTTLSEAINKFVESFIKEENSKPTNFLKMIKSKIKNIQHEEFRKYLLSIVEVPSTEAQSVNHLTLSAIFKKIDDINREYAEHNLKVPTEPGSLYQGIQTELYRLITFIDRLITNFNTNLNVQNIDMTSLNDALTISSYKIEETNVQGTKKYSIIRDFDLGILSETFTGIKQQTNNTVFTFKPNVKETISSGIQKFVKNLQKTLTNNVKKMFDETQTEDFKTRAARQTSIQAEIDAKFAEFSKLENEKKLNTFTVQTKKTPEGKYIVTITDSNNEKTSKLIAKDTVRQDDIKKLENVEQDDNEKLLSDCKRLDRIPDPNARIQSLTTRPRNMGKEEAQMHLQICSEIIEYDKANNKAKTSGGKTRKVRRKKTKKLKRKMGRKLSTRK